MKETVEKESVQKSKKEHVSGVRSMNDQGEQTSTPVFGGTRIEESITIGKAPIDVYTFWRDFTNIPRFCKNIQKVEVLDSKRSKWTAKGPHDKTLAWDAEILEDIPTELISWRSMENADLENAGSVHFREAPGSRGAEVRVTMTYNPPAGPVGAIVAKLSGQEPSTMVHNQLRRLKQLLETGEISTIDGQSTVQDQ